MNTNMLGFRCPCTFDESRLNILRVKGKRKPFNLAVKGYGMYSGSTA